MMDNVPDWAAFDRMMALTHRGVDFIMRQGIAGRYVSCQKGCSACCDMVVGVSLMEAIYIVRAMPDIIDSLRPALEKEMKRLTAPGVTTRNAWGVPCVFLKDRLCSIYDRRPMACRTHFVRNDPKHCEGNNSEIELYDSRNAHLWAIGRLDKVKFFRIFAPLPIAILIAADYLKQGSAWDHWVQKLKITDKGTFVSLMPPFPKGTLPFRPLPKGILDRHGWDPKNG